MITWHDQCSQAGELIVDGRPGDHGAHDKLRDANLYKGVDTAQDSIGRAPGGVGFEGDAWINALHQSSDLRTDVFVAKVEGDDSAVMVLWDNSLVLLSSLANGAHSLAGFLGGLVGAEETVSQTCHAFVCRRGASTKPHRNGLLLGLGIEGEFVRVVELACVRHRVFTPYAAHQGHVNDDSLTFLKRYDVEYYRGWARRTCEFARPLHGRFPWLARLCKSDDWFASLLAEPPTVIHGEFYAKTVLVRNQSVFMVDWESAAIAAGEIDLAALTEGKHWPAAIVRKCERAYVRARWPEGAPASFRRTLDAAKIYLHFRWLGERPDWTVREKSLSRYDHLHAAAKRLALL